MIYQCKKINAAYLHLFIQVINTCFALSFFQLHSIWISFQFPRGLHSFALVLTGMHFFGDFTWSRSWHQHLLGVLLIWCIRLWVLRVCWELAYNSLVPVPSLPRQHCLPKSQKKTGWTLELSESSVRKEMRRDI